MSVKNDSKGYEQFKKYFLKFVDNKPNRFHPLVWIHGNPRIGKNVYVGGFSEINAKGSLVKIGTNCDIASFVSINVADSNKKCIDISEDIERKPITIENNVFVGTHSFIGGGTRIGHHSVIGAGVILKNIIIPPYSLVINKRELVIKEGYYKNKMSRK